MRKPPGIRETHLVTRPSNVLIKSGCVQVVTIACYAPMAIIIPFPLLYFQGMPYLRLGVLKLRLILHIISPSLMCNNFVKCNKRRDDFKVPIEPFRYDLARTCQNT